MRWLFLAACVSAGCAPPFVVTDSFTVKPEGLFAGPVDSLHDYAVGTSFTLEIRAGRAFVDLKNVEVVSKNPEFLVVEEQSLVDNRIEARLTAVAEGTAALAFLDERQRPLEERVVEVKLPDEIVLGVNIDPAKKFTVPIIDTENMLMAVNGAVTFRVTYKREGSELKGIGVLVGQADNIIIENPTRNGPDREFVTLRAGDVATETSDVGLLVADTQITNLRVRTVDVSEVATIQLDEGELPTFRNDGDVYTVWAKAFTTEGAPVFGTKFNWTFDSAGLDGDGDLIQYTRQGSERRLLQANAGEVTEDLTVEAKAGTAQVGSTGSAGCASTPAPLLIALLSLFVRRRGLP